MGAFETKINVKGGDNMKKLAVMMRKLADQTKMKKFTFAPWVIIGEAMIKHSKDGYSRGKLVQTFLNLEIDLSKVINNTERLPRLGRIPPEEITKGLREFFLPNGNRIKIEALIDDPKRMFADILNDKRFPMEKFIRDLMKKSGLKDKKDGGV